jgi:hypothetical protein
MDSKLQQCDRKYEKITDNWMRHSGKPLYCAVQWIDLFSSRVLDVHVLVPLPIR